MAGGLAILVLLVIVGLIAWRGRRPPDGLPPPADPGRTSAMPSRLPRSHGVTPYAPPDEDFYKDEDEFAVFADEGEDDE
jgi:hypothetical protein